MIVAQHIAGPWVELSGQRRFPQGFKKYLMVRLTCNKSALPAQETYPERCMSVLCAQCLLCSIHHYM